MLVFLLDQIIERKVFQIKLYFMVITNKSRFLKCFQRLTKRKILDSFGFNSDYKFCSIEWIGDVVYIRLLENPII